MHRSMLNYLKSFYIFTPNLEETHFDFIVHSAFTSFNPRFSNKNFGYVLTLLAI